MRDRTPPDHGVGRGTPDRVVPALVFLVVGAAVLAVAVLYGATAHEEVGAALLTLSAVLSLWCGAYLWLRLRSPADEPETEATAPPFLPHSSPWPFAIGVGAFLLGNGLLVGGWFFVPGAAALTLGIGGFVRESRSRV